MKLSIVICVITALFSVMNANAKSYIVKLKKGQTESFIGNNLHQNMGQMSAIGVSFGEYILFEGTEANANKLKNYDAVEFMEPNYTYTILPVAKSGVANNTSDGRSDLGTYDPKFRFQWGLKNTGRNSGGWFTRGVAGMDINAESAWTMSRGSNDIIVAIIDTGVDYTHPDLADNIWTNSAELNGKPNVDDDGNGFIDDVHGYDTANNDGDPMDDNSHGTHCAGVIGAVHNNGRGIAGVMGSVKIMPLKFLTRSGSGTTAGAITAIEYAIKMGANVMSNSWGGGGFSQALSDAISAANDKGIVFVAAAGNARSDNDKKGMYPASYPHENVISVGAMDGKGNRASFSNYGRKSVHVFAPGQRIYSTVLKKRYKRMSGTSMAAPFVSGIAGLILSQENISPVDIRERLIKTSVPSANLSTMSVSRGRVDAYKVLNGI